LTFRAVALLRANRGIIIVGCACLHRRWRSYSYSLNIIVNKLVEREAFIYSVMVKSAVYIYHMYLKVLPFFLVSMMWFSLTRDAHQKKASSIYTARCNNLLSIGVLCGSI